jgi:hypothetical protein
MRIQIVTSEQIAQLAASHSVAFAGPAEKHKKAANVGAKSLSRTPSPPATQQQPCRFFAAGLCKHGSACHFSHVAPAPPPLSNFALVPAAPPSPGVPIPYSYVAHKYPVAAAVARPRPQAMPCSFATTRCSHQGGSHEQQGQSQQHQLAIMMMLLDKGLSSGKSFEAVVDKNSSATFKSL